MPKEVAVNLPFEANEIKEIAGVEFRKRLDGLCQLFGAKEYAAFELDFQVKIRLRIPGGMGGIKETLAWGSLKNGDIQPGNPALATEEQILTDTFKSKDPNEERMDRDMPLTIETTDGRGGKTRRKARIK